MKLRENYQAGHVRRNSRVHRTTRINGFSKDEEVRTVECLVINALHVCIYSNVNKKINDRAVLLSLRDI